MRRMTTYAGDRISLAVISISLRFLSEVSSDEHNQHTIKFGEGQLAAGPGAARD
jgi:hypothetical protein